MWVVGVRWYRSITAPGYGAPPPQQPYGSGHYGQPYGGGAPPYASGGAPPYGSGMYYLMSRSNPQSNHNTNTNNLKPTPIVHHAECVHSSRS
jgi:hypothetical protein